MRLLPEMSYRGRLAQHCREVLEAHSKLVASLALAAAMFFLLPSAASATPLPPTIEESTILTAAGSPYTGGSVGISPGVTLTIEPGVELKVEAMTVYGTLDVNGTASEPVVFTGAK